MRVLMVTSSYPKFPGDVTAPFIESIARGVAARGHAVDVLLPHHPDLRRGEDEPIRFFPYRYAPSDGLCLWGYAQSLEADVRVRREVYLLAPFVALSLRNRLGRLLEATRYDVVHVHWVVPSGVLVAGVLRARSIPWVLSLHGSDVFVAERSRLLRPPAGDALREAGAVTACSADLHARAVALGAGAERVRTVPYGVDVEAFSPEARTGGVRGRLGVPREAFFVLAVGRLVEKKGFRYLVEAAARTGGVRVVIAGEGDLRGALEEEARRLAAPVGFAGALDRATVAAALAEADAVVVPSVVDAAGNVDGLPNTLLEALAAGRAVVATRVAGIPDVVRDDDNGLLVPEKDPHALAEALRRLVREPETRERLAREARRTAVERLSWDAACRAFEECYAQATALDAR
ncbi:MAG: glycosyltransferase [Acidobacteria bacterium]|nr:glycosyltransferase [Acidobacteriota bacterium]